MDGRRVSASRRGGRGGGAGRRKAAVENDPKTQLLAEWHIHEEDCAARMIQGLARIYISRQRILQLLSQLYVRAYDPIEKKYYYVNTKTNDSTWEKPKVLSMFMPSDREVGTKKSNLVPHEAAKRIQRLVRKHMALVAIIQLVRENYMKLFDATTKTFYYLNTTTGATSDQRPPFLRSDKADLEIERFHFRNAVCKISTTTNFYGTGVIGWFCGILCVLSDNKTLPNEEIARTAHVVCNYVADRIPFNAFLASDQFFILIDIPSGSNNQKDTSSQFVLCALNEEQFLMAAGNNVVPLKLELNDRKMGCAMGNRLRMGDPIEVVGHPHGKMQVVHQKKLARILPNSINPLWLEYDSRMEAWAVGSAVFTRGGKLLGLQQLTSIKEPPPLICTYIKPVLDAGMLLVVPWYKPPRGLDLEFELEICRHLDRNNMRHDPFIQVSFGFKRSYHIGGLQSDTLYSVRCRGVNRMRKSGWSSPLRFITLPTPSMSWRLLHCSSMTEAVKRMQQYPSDSQVQMKSLQWMFTQMEQAQNDFDLSLHLEQELSSCHGMELILNRIERQLQKDETGADLLLSLRLLARLTQLKSRTQRFLSHLPHFQVLCDVLRQYTPTYGKTPEQEEQNVEDNAEKSEEELLIPMACIALMGYILDTNASAKQVCVVCSGISLILSYLERDSYRHQALMVAECCYLLSIFSYDNESGKWGIAEANGLTLLHDVLIEHINDAKVLYWALVTVGNVAYACDDDMRKQLDEQIQKLNLIDVVCQCKIHFSVRLRDLQLEMLTNEAKLVHLQNAHIGEEMRNELDACEHLVMTLRGVIDDMEANHVAQAADYALHHLLTENQRRVQEASIRIMRRFLQRKLLMALKKWSEVTVFERQCSIFRCFLTTIRQRQLGAAFRRWESIVRDLRKHKSIVQTIGSGLAIDLAKKRKERYRMLVLQK